MKGNDHWECDDATSDAGLQRQQEHIRRGLRRAQTTTVVALGVTLLLALGLVFHARRAEQNERSSEAATAQARAELRRSELARARAWRLSGAEGRREESLKAIRTAALLEPGADTRDEAVAALALMDIRPGSFHQPVPSSATAYAFSTDLSWCAVGGLDGMVTVMPASPTGEVRHFMLPRQPVSSVDFSPDHRLVAARYAGGAVRVWDVREAHLVFEANYAHREERPDSIGFHPHSRMMAVACEERLVRMVDLDDGVEQAPIRTEAPAWTARFDAAGRQLAVGVETYVHLYDSVTRAKIQSINTGERVAGLAWYPDGARLAAFAPYGRLMLVDTRTGGVRVLSGHTSRATALYCDPQGRLLLSTSWDGTTRFWDAGSGRPLLTTYAGFARGFDATGRRIGFYREGIEFGDWEVVHGQVFTALALPWDTHPMVQAIAFSPHGRWLAAGARDRVVVLDASNGRFLAEVRLPSPFGVAFTPDNTALVASGEMGIRRLALREEPERGNLQLGDLERMPGVPEGVFRHGAACAGHGRLFAAEGQTNITVVDLAAGRALGTVPVRRWHTSVAVSPDGRWVVGSLWKGGGTTVWDLATRKPVAEFSDFGGQAQFSPDSRQLLVGTAAEYVFIDTSQWGVTHRVARESFASAIYGMTAFEPGNRLAALTHNLRQLRLYAPESGATLGVLDSPAPERIRAVAFSASGQQLAAATDTGEVQVWHLDRIQRELAALGLEVKTGTSKRAPVHAGVVAVAWGFLNRATLGLTGAGVGLAMLVILYNLRRQRRLVAEYEALSTLAMQRRAALDAAQTRMMQSEKLKALGTLAAGIAHDFNNLLSVIRMAGQLVLRELRPDGTAKQNLEDIEQAVIQGKNLARSILGYSRTPAVARQTFPINEVVSETVAMLTKPFLSGIVLTLELAPGLPPWTGDKSRLEQILLNLIVNANEAMKGQGKLTIATRLVEHPKAGVLTPQSARQYLELTVRDSGPGISPDILPRIFEPFFTTKQAGVTRGTGLGLTSVFNIAQQDGLGLGVETQAGQGAAFHLTLPVEPAKNPG